MFFASIIGILIIIGFFYILWWKVIKPLLEGHGIEVDEEEPIETEHTKQLDKTKDEHIKTVKSAKAVERELELKKQMKYAEEDIEKAEDEIKKL